MGKDAKNPLLQPKNELLGFLRTMYLIRFCEEQLVKSYARGEIPGGMHTYIGEEATATGVCANLRVDDAACSAHIEDMAMHLQKAWTPSGYWLKCSGKLPGPVQDEAAACICFRPMLDSTAPPELLAPVFCWQAGQGIQPS